MRPLPCVLKCQPHLQTIYSHCLLLGSSELKCKKGWKKLRQTINILPNESTFPLLIFTCDIQTKSQTVETRALFSLCRRVYCKHRIRSRIPKGQATNKQTSKSTETRLTERITHCGSWLLWPYCGLAFICKATQRQHQRAFSLQCTQRIKPALSAGITRRCLSYHNFP